MPLGKMVADKAVAACTTSSFAAKPEITTIPAGNAMQKCTWVVHKVLRLANAVQAMERIRGIIDSDTKQQHG